MTVETTIDPTRQLVELARAGDREAYGELYRLYRPTVLAFLLRRLGGPARRDAEDITNATFTRGLASIERFEFVGRDVGAWFITIARNLLADHFKGAYYRLSVVVDDIPEIPVPRRPLSDLDDPHRAGVLRELRTDIEAALAGLTPDQERVIRLRYLDELSIDEIASAMDLTVGAVKALQYRATGRLRRSERLAAHR